MFQDSCDFIVGDTRCILSLSYQGHKKLCKFLLCGKNTFRLLIDDSSVIFSVMQLLKRKQLSTLMSNGKYNC